MFKLKLTIFLVISLSSTNVLAEESKQTKDDAAIKSNEELHAQKESKLTQQEKIMKKSAALALLKKAERFYTDIPSESGYTAIQKAYQEARSNLKDSDTNELYQLQESQYPAARVYGAILVLLSGRPEARTSCTKLKEDTATFQYQSGCKVTSSTVKEFVCALLESESFLDFSLKEQRKKAEISP